MLSWVNNHPPLTAGLDIALPASNPPAQRLPVIGCKVRAGFPSPADDYVEGRIDLNEHLIRNKEATFILRVKGWSMKEAGIHDGDELIVDRSMGWCLEISGEFA